MIIYEIEAKVQRELIEKFEQFMNESHIPDMLETGHFMNAEMRMLSEDSYQIKYYCEDRVSLDGYLETDAQALRDDFVKHFPKGVSISRKVREE